MIDQYDDETVCYFEKKVGSVRSCPGEPYSSDYDTTFGVSKIKYLRHQVLFNLYNFDLDQSRYNELDEKMPLVKLSLKNCEFKYFLKDYEALIYAETSIVERVNTLFAEPYIVQMGDDRGVQIDIENSAFRHSSFCKGLIVFREQPEILPIDVNFLVFNFKYESERHDSDWDKYRLAKGERPLEDWPYIRSTGSVFENLNHGRNITHLSFTEDGYYSTTINSMPDSVNAKKYPYFDNHGAVLNVEGFPGRIEFTKNTIKNNMYFIRDVFPSYRKLSDTLTPFASFLTQEENQIQMIKCESNGAKKRFFGDYLKSTLEQDSGLLSKLEKHSAIYIAKPKWPVIFTENTFDGNVGIFGGAVSINSPVFRNTTDSSLINSVDKQPVILIADNTFTNNQAYLSGNAVYLRYTRQHYTNTDFFEEREKEYLCGGGLLIKGNDFKNNAAIIHASHGGAISIECDFVSEQVEVSRGATSPRIETSEINNGDV